MENSLTWTSSACVMGPWVTQIGMTVKWTLSFLAWGVEDKCQLDRLGMGIGS